MGRLTEWVGGWVGGRVQGEEAVAFTGPKRTHPSAAARSLPCTHLDQRLAPEGVRVLPAHEQRPHAAARTHRRARWRGAAAEAQVTHYLARASGVQEGGLEIGGSRVINASQVHALPVILVRCPLAVHASVLAGALGLPLPSILFGHAHPCRANAACLAMAQLLPAHPNPHLSVTSSCDPWGASERSLADCTSLRIRACMLGLRRTARAAARAPPSAAALAGLRCTASSALGAPAGPPRARACAGPPP